MSELTNDEVVAALRASRKRPKTKTNLHLETDLVEWMKPRYDMSRLVNELLRRAKNAEGEQLDTGVPMMQKQYPEGHHALLVWPGGAHLIRGDHNGREVCHATGCELASIDFLRVQTALLDLDMGMCRAHALVYAADHHDGWQVAVELATAHGEPG